MGEGIMREFGMDMDTLLLKMDNQRGPSVQHRELCSVLCGSLDGRESGGEWIHALSSFTVHLKLS